ncbi:MAG: RNA-binding protein [Hyphomonadaceae bacterium]
MSQKASVSDAPELAPDAAAPETDNGPGRGRASPERRCIATMERRAPSEMIRFVLGPDGAVTPDLAGRLPGRGAWVTASREAIERAAKRGAFSRAFRTQAAVPDNLADLVETLLVRRLMENLGLARRSGDLSTGFEGVREMIRAGRPGAVLEARDGAADGRGKVLALLKAAHTPEDGESGPETPIVGCFSAEELGMALGGGRVVHACLRSGRFAQSWLGELGRLAGFRAVLPPDWASRAEQISRDCGSFSGPGRIPAHPEEGEPPD